MQFLETLVLTSVAEILKSDSPSFALIRRQENGQAISQAILSKLIIDFLEFFNIGKTMNENQIVSTVKLILEDYSVLKPDDFVLFFNRAKKGTYGKVYDRLDGAVILEWLEIFMQDRNSEIEQIRVNEAKRFEKSEPTAENTIYMPEWFKEWLESWKKEDRIKNIEKKPLNQTDEQIYYSQLLKEFDTLYVQQGSTTGLKMVKIGEGFYDSYEYLQYRLKNDE